MAGFFTSGAILPQSGGFALIALALMVAEFLFHKVNHVESHDAGESAASLAIAAGNKVIGALTASLGAVPVFFVAQHRLFDIPMRGVAVWAALFLAVEFCYFLHHLAMHKVRWLWATHSVHHSATRLNLSAAVRIGWGGHLTGGLVFYLPLVALGFPPLAVFGMLGAGLVYQFFLHLARPPHLGPLEWVLNTPRHHAVHHASNASVVDRNFGGVLIVFDRLFGTFAEAPRGEPLSFGVAGATTSRNPLAIVFGVWLAMLRDAGRTPGLGNKLRVLFGPPG
ncbi:sterol desaturase family protein [Xanthobacter autotrophicus]|uniref:sterol desaturase family protein n=1 Tax=Xanthobacter autotrophicus TaxID=280 RepID=UPI0024A63F9B|nr:sterol desaturase family protein [Xanthobacter autotrophicus]MDI4658567.1 sterol desaturase family protein [Xanthobacter autotrophicus]